MKVLWYAQLVTAAADDPAAAAAFDRETLKRHGHGKKRVGHPRLNWVETTQTQFWELMIRPMLPEGEDVGLDLEIQQHVDTIKDRALEVANDRGSILRALGY